MGEVDRIDFGKIWPGSSQIVGNSAEFCRKSVKLWPELTQFWRCQPNVARFRQTAVVGDDGGGLGAGGLGGRRAAALEGSTMALPAVLPKSMRQLGQARGM